MRIYEPPKPGIKLPPEEALRVFVLNPSVENYANLSDLLGAAAAKSMMRDLLMGAMNKTVQEASAPRPVDDEAILTAPDKERLGKILAREERYKLMLGGFQKDGARSVLVNDEAIDDVLWLVAHARRLHDRLSNARWHMCALRDSVNLARLAGQGDEQEWRRQNGVARGNVPAPGDKCGHNHCLGTLRAAETPHCVRCDRCATLTGPGPGAAEALEAAEYLGRQEALRDGGYERELDRLMEQLDERVEQIEQIHAALGHCDEEWTNGHDLGACAVQAAGEMATELRRLRLRDKKASGPI